MWLGPELKSSEGARKGMIDACWKFDGFWFSVWGLYKMLGELFEFNARETTVNWK
jgi:hypothetical protein